MDKNIFVKTWSFPIYIAMVLSTLLIPDSHVHCEELILRVIDKEAGLPVYGARVSISAYEQETDQRLDLELLTDESGQCAVPILNSFPYSFLIRVTADEYLECSSEWKNDPADRRVTYKGSIPGEYTVSLEKPVQIGGRVTDESGSPISDVKIFIKSLKVDGRNESVVETTDILTDSDGSWVCRNVHDQAKYIDIAFVHQYYSAECVTEYPKESAYKELYGRSYSTVLKESREINGYVRDKDGNPVDGAIINYGSHIGLFRDKLEFRVTTDSGGWFSIVNAPKEAYHSLLVEAEGYTPSNYKLEPDSQRQGLEIILYKGTELRARVVDEKDDPVEGARVTAFGLKDRSDLLWVGRTDEEGRFKWDSAPSKELRISVNHGKYGYNSVTLSPGSKEHIIVLKRKSMVSGHVYDQYTGEPIKEFAIIPGTKKSKESEIVWMFRDKIPLINEEGYYEYILRNPFGETVLTIEADGYENAVSAGFGRDDGAVTFDFHLVPKYEDVRVDFEGTIMKKNTDIGLAGVTVVLIDTSLNDIGGGVRWETVENNYPVLEAETDEEGKFSFSNLPFETAAILLKKDGYAVTLLDGINLRAKFIFGLSPGSVIRGTVRDYDYQPVSNAMVNTIYLNGIEMYFDYLRTDKEGRFEINNLPAGRYKIDVSGVVRSGEDTHRINMTHIADVGEGVVYEIDWSRISGTGLYGKILLDEKPVFRAVINAYAFNRRLLSYQVQSDINGNYLIPLHEPGKYIVRFVKIEGKDDPKGINIQKDIEVIPGLNRLDINLGGSITVRAISGEDKQPVPNAGLYAYKKQAESNSGRKSWNMQHINPRWTMECRGNTDENGICKFDNVSSGEGLIVYMTGRYGQEISDYYPGDPFELKGMEDKDVLMDLKETVELRMSLESGGELKEDREYNFPVEFSCINEDGYVFYPKKESIETDNRFSRKYELREDEQGRILFGCLPPGKYTLFSEATEDFCPAKLEFEVPDYFEEKEPVEGDKEEKAEEESEKEIFHDVTLPLYEGGRLVFHLSAEMKGLEFSSPWVGYRLTDEEGKKPVLGDAYGPYWGGVLNMDKDSLEDVSLTLPPGKYSLEAVLRDGQDYLMSSSDKNLWTYFGKIEIKKNENNVIQIAQ